MARLRIIDDEILESPFNAKQFFRMMAYVRPYSKRLLSGLLLMVIEKVASLSIPFFMSQIMAVCLVEGAMDMTQFPYLIGGMVIAVVLMGVCQRARIRLVDVSGRKAIADLREALFHHIQELPFTFFDNRSAGKIMVRVINDVNSLNDLFSNGIINLIIDCLTLVLLVIIMLVFDWRLTLIALSVLPVLGIVIFTMRRKMRKGWQIVRTKLSIMHGYLHECLAGMRVIQSFVRERENDNLYTETNAEIRDSWMKTIRINNVFWPTLDVLSAIGTVLVYGFGVAMIGPTGGLSVATLMLILWYLGRFWDPLNNISGFYNNILSAMASIERIFEIMDTPLDIQSKEGAPVLPIDRGEVEFDHVTFAYDPEKVVLKDVSFTVTPGQTIALVGPTGAGKSTIVNLISRFYDVTDGAVRIDGMDVRDVDLHSLREGMGVMMQDSFIFSDTLMNNIRYGRLDATDEEVIAAAKAVHAHEFIMAMEKGYETEVNERGSRLSTGQKQLVSFARALLNDPRILILDEATSSIDTQTERLIQKALEKLLEGRTSFVIAHRLSTIRRADRIMVVEGGCISESGTHEELMHMRGTYYGLVQAQVAALAS